ncbi:hypothetical protein C8R43DRAFT_1124887 [Mycena crocata]|nr:hypothetical protein C8R43DRAFT_1124887 [Mycena crocata]
MADGRLLPSIGTWTGSVDVGGVTREGTFEVFDSGGAWAVLFGKPLLESFEAVHDYKADVLWLPPATIAERWKSLPNQFLTVSTDTGELIGLTTDIKQRTKFRGGQCASPSRQVPSIPENIVEQVDQQKIQIIKLADLGWRNESIEDIKKRTKFRGGQCASPSRQVHSRLESIPEEQIDQLEMQENQPRSSEWYNRNQRRKRTNEKYAVDVEEGGIAKIEVVEEMLKSGKPDVRDVTRGKELNPPLRQVQNPVDLPIAERNDDPPRPQIARPVTSLGVERRSAEQRASWRAYMGVSKRGIVNPEHTWGASDVNKRASVVGNENFPSREVPPHMPADAKLPDIDGLRSWNRTTIVNEDWRQISLGASSQIRAPQIFREW